VVTTSGNVTNATVLLDSRLIDFQKPVTLELNGKTTPTNSNPICASFAKLCNDAAIQNLSFTAEMPLPLENKSK
jgi:hypothetical protein